jgi:hypothetical protein
MRDPLLLRHAEGARTGRKGFGPDRPHHAAREWREFSQFPPGVFVTVMRPFHRERCGDTYVVGVERRTTTVARPDGLRSMQVMCAAELLDRIMQVACDLAGDRPAYLSMVLDDALDPGVSARCALLLLAAAQGEHDAAHSHALAA